LTPFINVIVQYCHDQLPGRQAEYDACVRANLANPWVASLHNLVEPAITVPEDIRTNARYVEHSVKAWLTYTVAFDYANRFLAGQVVCLMNLDTFLAGSSDWAAALPLLDSNAVLCLSRHEFDGERVWRDVVLEKMAFANSQDACLFRAPISVAECDFEIGSLGCDNAIADRLRRSGYLPYNAPRRFPIIHFDQARGKTSENYLAVHLSETKRIRRHPEEQGQYLVPDADQVTSIDALLDSLDVPSLDRYKLACDVMSRYIKVKNPG
jgi:hypothetical protein